MEQLTWLFSLSILICVFIFLILYKLLSISDKYPEIKEYDSENFYLDGPTKKEKAFPSFKDPPSCTLSVIVPAYNEEERLPPMLEETVGYLEEVKSQKQNFTYEIIIVDDGSADATSEVGHKYSDKLGTDKIRVLTLIKNRGKGGAVRLGMMRSRGEMLLFADADGATKFSDFSKVEDALLDLCKDNKNIDESLGIVCGSRSHLEKESVAQRSFLRTILMYGFHFVVWLFTVRGIKDTQCGFKLLTRRTARIVFRSLHIERWAFDVEMLFIAQKLGIPIKEVAVTWTEIDGSKVTPVLSWLQMGRDLILIWIRYILGIWRIRGDFPN